MPRRQTGRQRGRSTSYDLKSHRSSFEVRGSKVVVRRSAFDVRRSTFGVRRSAFDVRRSTFDGRIIIAATMRATRRLAVASAAAALLIAPATGAQQAWNVPHTPWGDPDFQGIWTYATMTPLERP